MRVVLCVSAHIVPRTSRVVATVPVSVATGYWLHAVHALFLLCLTTAVVVVLLLLCIECCLFTYPAFQV